MVYDTPAMQLRNDIWKSFKSASIYPAEINLGQLSLNDDLKYVQYGLT